MWHALRAELNYSRPWLLGALGIAAGVVVLINVIFRLVGDNDPTGHEVVGISAVFPVMAPMIAGFVVQAYRNEERRTRLLLAAPLTPRQIAVAMVLLPVILFGIGVLAGGLVVATVALVTGRLEMETLQMVGYVGSLMFMMTQMGLLAQEATAAHRQQRRRSAAAGWAGFAVAVLILTTLSLLVIRFQGPLTWISLHLGNLAMAVVAMVASVTLYAGRTDFTR